LYDHVPKLIETTSWR